MTDLPGQQNLLYESMGGLGIRSDFRKDHLQGDPAAVKQVILYFVDLTHAAPCDESDDEESSGDHIASLESCFLTRCIRVTDIGRGVSFYRTIKERPFEEAAGALVFHQ